VTALLESSQQKCVVILASPHNELVIEIDDVKELTRSTMTLYAMLYVKNHNQRTFHHRGDRISNHRGPLAVPLDGKKTLFYPELCFQ